MIAPPRTPEQREEEFSALVSSAPAGGADLIALCDERNRVYEEQPSAAVTRMRGWLMTRLAASPLPDAALPFVLEELETAHDPYLIAAAARCLRAYPNPDASFAGPLRAALANGRDSPVSLDRYGGLGGEAAHVTSPLDEVVAAIAWLGPLAAPLAGDLRAIVEARAASSRVLAAAATVLERLPAEGSACCPGLPVSLLGRWRRSAEDRTQPDLPGSVTLEDQDGRRHSYQDVFRGRPTIVVYFYTRCDNPLKCALTVSKLGKVQQLLADRGLTDSVGTAAISYDAAYDTPERLARYGRNRGLRTGAGHGLYRAVEGNDALRQHFELGVSFFESLVSRHRIEVFVLDSRGRIAASFTRLNWNEEAVVEEAAALLAESGSRPAAPLWGLIAPLVPKCPACWASYMSSIGATGFGAGASAGALRIAAFGFLAVHLGLVAWRVRTTGWHWAQALSLAGAVAVGVHLATNTPAMMAGGMAAMLAASAWQVMRTRPVSLFHHRSGNRVRHQAE